MPGSASSAFGRWAKKTEGDQKKDARFRGATTSLPREKRKLSSAKKRKEAALTPNSAVPRYIYEETRESSGREEKT